jgi:hypothetical protein
MKSLEDSCWGAASEAATGLEKQGPVTFAMQQIQELKSGIYLLPGARILVTMN